MDEIVQNILNTPATFPTRLPNVPKDSSENIKSLKEEIKVLIDSLKELVNDESYIENYKKTLPYIQIICEIIEKLDDEINIFKEKEDAYEFIDIEIIATNLILENNEIRDELKSKFKEIMIDEYQDTNDLQEFFISLIQNNNIYLDWHS